MKLQSFQLLNCFGFRDSGVVNLNDENNFIYVLGRNSSGKSSLLNAIRYFETGITPNSKANFYNFNPTTQDPRLIAEFSLQGATLSVDMLIKRFFNNKTFNSIGLSEQNLKSYPKMDALIKGIRGVYGRLIEQLVKDGVARIEKTGQGNYLFAQHPPFKEFNLRRDEVSKLISAAQESNGTFLVGGTHRQLDISFNAFENLLFWQFPQILIFNESYSLRESLPERITLETLNEAKSNKFLSAFVAYLGEEKVRSFLQSNDPDERDALRAQLQSNMNELTQKVNYHASSVGNKDLLEIRLHEKNGLQITVQTDKKKSFYSHISENTKFLFAYYMYQERENISGRVLLFDEPSNGFHPTSQEFILNFLKSLANQNLVIVATHSEYLIDLNHLSGVRLMSVDSSNYLTVRNHIYNQPVERGDYYALKPVLDAIGYSYGRQLVNRDKVIITEGITDMLYLRAFNTILKLNGELNIAPSRGDAQILNLIPFFISQGISFKIVIDTGKVKEIMKKSFGIDESFIYEIPIPTPYIGKMDGSGIEDLFTKEDFKKLLLEVGETIDASYEHVSNSFYIRERLTKRLVAHNLYERAASMDASQFDMETLDKFRAVLDFCKKDNWFNV